MTALVLAVTLDVLIGDPFYAWHPVRLMGRLINWGENFLRRLIANPRIAGIFLGIALPTLIYFSAAALQTVLFQIHFVLGWVVEVILLYMCLSIHDMNREGKNVYAKLKSGNLEESRTALSRIVGRNTQHLEKTAIIRAAVESISESLVDGIIAPMFFALLGGAPLALAYKAVNTLDSMVGHKNKRYMEFGWFSAKQDELWNWIPARLSYFIIGASAMLMRLSSRVWHIGWRDGITQRENSPVPEAAFAGAMGLRLGGPAYYYDGQLIEKAALGEDCKEPETEDILRSLNLMLLSSFVALGAFIMIGLLV